MVVSTTDRSTVRIHGAGEQCVYIYGTNRSRMVHVWTFRGPASCMDGIVTSNSRKRLFHRAQKRYPFVRCSIVPGLVNRASDGADHAIVPAKASALHTTLITYNNKPVVCSGMGTLHDRSASSLHTGQCALVDACTYLALIIWFTYPSMATFLTISNVCHSFSGVPHGSIHLCQSGLWAGCGRASHGTSVFSYANILPIVNILS